MSIAGHVSQQMLAHYSHVRIEAKRKALDALAVGIKTVGYDAKNDTKSVKGSILSSQALKRMAGTTGLEPAASAVTGQRSNQLNYVPTRQIYPNANRQCSCGFTRFAYYAWNSLCRLKRSRFLSESQLPANFGISVHLCDAQYLY